MTTTPINPANTLRPCRWCNGTNLHVHEEAHPNDHYDFDSFYIRCQSCMARGPEKKTGDEAIASWNTRSTDTLLTQCRDAMQDAIDQLSLYAPIHLNDDKLKILFKQQYDALTALTKHLGE